MSNKVLLDTEYIKAEAQNLGFNACGIAKAEIVNQQHQSYFKQWLQNGCAAEMNYMYNYKDVRLNPQLLVEHARTIICVAYSYYPAHAFAESDWQLAWYAYGQDYHTIMRNKLMELFTLISHKYEGIVIQGRCFCDTAPLLEKYWAMQAGLGWIGKHTQLVIPHLGSAFFLGEIVLDQACTLYDTPMPSHCGNCTRCIDACPTQAIVSGMDARKCLSYLTIENRGEIPCEAAQRMSPYIYGCDRCLRACPHLSDSAQTKEPLFAPSSALLSMTPQRWSTLTIDEYRSLFKGSAVKRAKYEGLMRNIKAIKRIKP